MTVFELHLQIDQKLQEQGSYQRDRIFPEAKDLALNEAMLEKLRDYTEYRFGDRESKLKAIEPLVVRNVTIPTNVVTSADDIYEQYARFTILPPDFFYGVNYRGEVVTDTFSCETAPTIGTTTKTDYISVLPFPTTLLGTGPYFNNFKIEKSGPTTTIYQVPTTLNNRFYSTDQKYEIINNVLDTVNVPRSATRIYWESYKGAYHKNSFIIVSDTILNTVTATIYQSDGVTQDAISTGTGSTTVYTRTNRNLIDTTTGAAKTYPSLKLLEPDALYKSKLNKFTSSRANNPHGSRASNYFWVFEAASFIVTAVVLDYIRKPRTISLVLNQSCELDPSVHNEVVDRAVEILKLNIQDPSVQGDVQYNQITTRN